MPDGKVGFGGPDEQGLSWCVPGGAAAINPAWFPTLVSVMGAADCVAALEREGFTLDTYKLAAGVIDAQDPSGLRLLGDSSLLTAALCYWEDYNLKFAANPARHARQKAAFDQAYDAARAMGLAVLGEPTLQGRDPDEFKHRWSLWRIGEVVLAVHQALGDLLFGLSIQADVRRYPADAPLQPRSPFVDWMWWRPP
jgi:hypothetical protein